MTRNAFDRHDTGRNPRRSCERPLHPGPRRATLPSRRRARRRIVRTSWRGLRPPVTPRVWARCFSGPRRRRPISAANTRSGHVRAVFVPRTHGKSRSVCPVRRCRRRSREQHASPCGSRTGRDVRVEEPRLERRNRAPARPISSTRCHRRSRACSGESASPSRRPKAYLPIADPAKDR